MIILLWVAIAVIAAMILRKLPLLLRLTKAITLFSEANILRNFSNMHRVMPTRTLPRGDGLISPLPDGAPYTLPDDVQAWMADRTVTSLLIMKDGAVVHEGYYHGTQPQDRRISWSVAKSYISALFGILLDEGVIDSINSPVTKYVPALAGTAYDGVSIRNVLRMSTGVTFDEDYLAFWSDVNRMGRVLALGGSMDAFTAARSDRFAPAGETWEYCSIDTHVLGMVIRGASGRDVADLMAEKVIAPLGQEDDATYLTDGHGVSFVLGGLNLRTRDYARFGQMIAQGGTWQGQQIVPADWILESGTPKAKTPAGETRYGYQWWVPQGYEQGEFLARGIYGQYIYINQPRGVVIVGTAADRRFREDGRAEENDAMLHRIAMDV